MSCGLLRQHAKCRVYVIQSLCSVLFSPFETLPSLHPLLFVPIILSAQPTQVNVLMQGTEQRLLCESFVSHHLCFFALRVWKTDTVSSFFRPWEAAVTVFCSPPLTSPVATGASWDWQRWVGGLAWIWLSDAPSGANPNWRNNTSSVQSHLSWFEKLKDF